MVGVFLIFILFIVIFFSMVNEKYNIKIKDLEKSQIEIDVEIPWKEVGEHRKSVISEFSEKITVPGFRKGRVPEDILVKKIGQVELLNEMIERAIQKYILK